MDWIENIKKLGIQPPKSDEVCIRVDLPPVSLQSSASSRGAFIKAIREKCAEYTFLICADVQVEVTWFVHEQERYETDRSPDVDNILKPLLDGLSGPEGLLIDDNQVQSICCSWIDWTSRDEAVEVRIRFFHDEAWVPKGHFRFIQFDKGLCYPIATYWPIELQEACVSIFEKGFNIRANAEKNGFTYEDSRGLMPQARIFHRTRIGRFEVITLDEFKNEIGKL